MHMERPWIAHETNSNTKGTSDTSNGSKGDILTTTSVTKIETMTNKNSKNKPYNGIKTEHRKLMTEDKDKLGDNGKYWDKWNVWISKIQEARQLQDLRPRLRQICQQYR